VHASVSNARSGRAVDRRADRRKGFPQNSYFAAADDGFQGKAELAQVCINDELETAFPG
jgi:hypothetical protein